MASLSDYAAKAAPAESAPAASGTGGSGPSPIKSLSSYATGQVPLGDDATKNYGAAAQTDSVKSMVSDFIKANPAPGAPGAPGTDTKVPTTPTTFAQKYNAFSDRIGQLGAEMDIGALQSTGGLIGGLNTLGNWIVKPLGKAIDAAMGTHDSAKPTPNAGDMLTSFATSLEKDTGVKDKNYLDDVFQGLGSAIPYIAGGTVSTALKIPALISSLGIGGLQALSTARDTYHEMVASGDKNASLKAAGVFGVDLALNTVAHFLGPLAQGGSEGLMSSLGRILKSTLLETANYGVGQTIVSNVAAGRAPMEGVWQNALVMLPISGAFGGAGELANSAHVKAENEQVKNLVQGMADDGHPQHLVVSTIAHLTGVPQSKVEAKVGEIVSQTPELKTTFEKNLTKDLPKFEDIATKVIPSTPKVSENALKIPEDVRSQLQLPAGVNHDTVYRKEMLSAGMTDQEATDVLSHAKTTGESGMYDSFEVSKAIDEYNKGAKAPDTQQDDFTVTKDEEPTHTASDDVKEVLGQLSDSQEAQEDWADNHADKYGELAGELAQLEKQLRQTKDKTVQAQLKAQGTKIGNEMGKMENDFIAKYEQKAAEMVAGRKTAKVNAENVATHEEKLRAAYKESGTGLLKGEKLPEAPTNPGEDDGFGGKEMTLEEHQLQVKELESQPKAARALYQVATALELSEPGFRIIGDNTHNGTDTIGVSSTFPKWIPEELRSKELFEKIFPSLHPDNLSYPSGNKPRLRRLYDLLLDEVDSMVGTDTSKIRGDILKEYGEEKEKAAAGGSDRGAEGSEAAAGSKENPVASKLKDAAHSAPDEETFVKTLKENDAFNEQNKDKIEAGEVEAKPGLKEFAQMQKEDSARGTMLRMVKERKGLGDWARVLDKELTPDELEAQTIAREDLAAGRDITPEIQKLLESGEAKFRKFIGEGEKLSLRMERDAAKAGEPFDMKEGDARAVLTKLLSGKEFEFLFHTDGYIKSTDEESGKVHEAHGRYIPADGLHNPIIELVMSNGMVQSKTLYHEAFHAYLDHFVSPSDKAALFERTQAHMLTLPGRTALRVDGYGHDEVAEEWLTHDLEKYVADKGHFEGNTGFYKSVVNTVRGWVRKLVGAQRVYDDFLAGKRVGPKRTTVTNRMDGILHVRKNALSVRQASEAPPFEGFSDISTKVLGKLEGRTTVSKQFIADLTNSADLKQSERDVIRETLAAEGDQVRVADFADRVKERLLPLERKLPGGVDEDSSDFRYEGIALPGNERGPIAGYSENIYSSPVKTSAGNVHFSGEDNYFAHSRVEDLPVGEVKITGKDIMGEPIYDMPSQHDGTGGTRRVIEIQSDLFQKGRLENEVNAVKSDAETYNRNAELLRKQDAKGNASMISEQKADAAKKLARSSDLAKLEPYRNTWHERIIREEVKQAAVDGKASLQFPTGETAMKIEGLGENNNWFASIEDVSRNRTLAKDELSVGQTIYQDTQFGNVGHWVVTDVLGDGKFKAVTEEFYNNMKGRWLDVEKDANWESRLDSHKESFDISGKIDTENPIYKFYEKEVGRYLKNKYGAEKVTDDQGVSWWQLKVNPDEAKKPVQAFKLRKGGDDSEMTDEERAVEFYRQQREEKAAAVAKSQEALSKEVASTLANGGRIGAATLAEKYNLSAKDVKEAVAAYVDKRSGPAGTSAAADIGTFQDGTPIKLGSMDTIRPIELPEMVQLARDLMGQVPKVRKNMGNKLGLFRGKEGGEIELSAKIFDKPEQVAKTLAHEIGHLTDYLPEHTLKRGNLLGRLLSIQNLGKEAFWSYENGDTVITNKDIRAELLKVSEYWRPYDKTTANPSFVKYRNSGKELYADSVSMLFNSPGLLQEMAPKFYREFFDNLDKKPLVRDAYFETQALLSGDKESLIQARRAGVQQMFKDGDYKAIELQNEKIAEREKRNSDIFFKLKFELVDKNAAVIQRVSMLEKKGIKVNPDDNPVFYLEERNYLGGKIKGIMDRDINPVYQSLQKAGVDWGTFGEAMFYERIIAGDRSKQANPRGITPDVATELRAALDEGLTDSQRTALTEGVVAFREALRGVATEAYGEGLYTPELYQQMQDNPAYVTFQVLDHMDEGMNSKVYKSIGTLKDISNPADASILKMIATVRAIERNKVTRTTVDFLKEFYPEEVENAKAVFNGTNGQRFIESKRQDQEMVMLYRNGKAEGHYVDPYIKKSLDNESIGQTFAVVSALRFMNSHLFRPLFIGFNLGFQSFNFVRDFLRTYKTTDMTFTRTVQRYIQSMPLAKARAFGVGENPSARMLDAQKTLQMLEHDQVFATTFTDLVSGKPGDEMQIETILRNSGIDSFKPEVKNAALRPFVKVLDFITNVGNLIETLPKAAGYYEITKGGNRALTKEEASYIRKNIGSPDFLAGGHLKPATNEVFLFSNAIAQGVRSDVNVATNPATRGAYWYKTAKVNIVPKLLMFAAGAGLFGAQIKKMMQDASEYDKTNYTIVPLGSDTNGNTIYFRMPQDEMGRLLGGIFWKSINIMHSDQSLTTQLGDLASFMGGQAPNVSPVITTAQATAQFLGGQNPYDSFRGRNIMSNDVYAAGGIRADKAFLGWVFNELGGGIFYRFDSSNQSPTPSGAAEKIFNLPVVSNILGRFVRVTNYGEQEQLNIIKQRQVSEEAAARLDRTDIVNKYIGQYQAETNPTDATKAKYESDIVKEALGHAPGNSDEATIAANLKSKFEAGLVRGAGDPALNALSSATSNAQKNAILQKLQDTLTPEDYSNLVDTAVKNKIISPQVKNAATMPVPQVTPNKPQSENGIINTVATYAKAIGTDPVTAFERIFTGQVIRRVDSGAIIVDRMSLNASEAEKRAQAGTGSVTGMRLDHTVPLELGGGNDKGNLKLVSESQWASYTPIENLLGKALRAGTINKTQAQTLITKFKNGDLTASQVEESVK